MAFGKLKVRGRNEKTIEVQSTGGDSIIRVDTLNATSGEPAVTCTSDVTVAGASITVTGTGEKVTTPGLAVGAGDLTVTGGSITVTGTGESVTAPKFIVGADGINVNTGVDGITNAEPIVFYVFAGSTGDTRMKVTLKAEKGIVTVNQIEAIE